MLLTEPVFAVKLAVVALADTVTDAGTVRVVLLLLSVTVAPPAGAAGAKVTVQVLEAFCPRLVGLHATDEVMTAAARLTVAVAELPLYAAVIVAD